METMQPVCFVDAIGVDLNPGPARHRRQEAEHLRTASEPRPVNPTRLRTA